MRYNHIVRYMATNAPNILICEGLVAGEQYNREIDSPHENYTLSDCATTFLIMRVKTLNGTLS